ncbi:MAG: hypothetical protein GY820_18240 [Gammaproteobacteria bacterium]|nr:hypothetical protein [Gammaproteobacteria bacterium]
MAVRVLELWSQKPISAKQFAKESPFTDISQRDVAEIISKSEQYGVMAEPPKRKKRIPSRWVNSEMRRGALTTLDTVYLKGYFGSTQFALVHVDRYSGLVQLEPLSSLTGRSATEAFQRIINRLPYPRIKNLISDAGSGTCVHTVFNRKIRVPCISYCRVYQSRV